MSGVSLHSTLGPLESPAEDVVSSLVPAKLWNRLGSNSKCLEGTESRPLGREAFALRTWG